jgi:hypothetical protein
MVVKEILKYYMDNGSDVYMCCIDATKAFDKIRHDKLFLLLIDRGISGLDLRLLLDLYQRQKIRTSWQGKVSDIFGVSNGIRQGSIASPILFCCYMDVLIQKLQYEGIGCWIGGHFCASIAYADDLTLLSPSIAGLQNLITACEQFGNEFNMSYNPKKSFCVQFSRKNKTFCDLYLDGNKLDWLPEAKHLGNYISSTLTEYKEVSMKKSDLIGRVNTLVSNMPSLISRKVIMTVFRSQCCHFYGVQTWQLTDKSISDFIVLWNKCVRRLLKLPRKTHRRFLHHLAEMPDPLQKICSMFLSMYTAMTKSRNELINFIARRGHMNQNTIIGMNLNFIKRLYSSVDIKHHSCACTVDDNTTVEAIKDCLDSKLDNFFSYEERVLWLSTLCES